MELGLWENKAEWEMEGQRRWRGEKNEKGNLIQKLAIMKSRFFRVFVRKFCFQQITGQSLKEAKSDSDQSHNLKSSQ